MAGTCDPLLARATAAIESARDARSETQRIVDTAQLQRLERDLIRTILQVERLRGATVRRRKHADLR